MSEKDLDIAIEKCKRIMEFDTRTLKNPESEDGWLFDKVYELLKFLRQFQFETGGMDDTISRRAAIDAAIEAVDDWDGGTNIGRQKRIEKYINALPSAQQWIPCSKKLPEPNRSVLVQLSDDFVDPIQIMTLDISKLDGDFFCFWRTQEMGIIFDMDDVVAWMPSPKPWEGEKP